MATAAVACALVAGVILLALIRWLPTQDAQISTGDANGSQPSSAGKSAADNGFTPPTDPVSDKKETDEPPERPKKKASDPAADETKADPDVSLYDRILSSTVWVICPIRNDKAATGTGSIVDLERRLVITNDHVADADSVFVFLPWYRNGELENGRDDYFRNATRYLGKVVLRDHKRDLALIELQSLPAEAVEIVLAPESPRPGQEVHTVGNPEASGALWVYTSGRVRTVYDADFTTADGQHVQARIVETDSPINEGDSGGPVVNSIGELIAVNQSHSVNARLVSNSIDISEVRKFLEEYADSSP